MHGYIWIDVIVVDDPKLEDEASEKDRCDPEDYEVS